MSETGHKYSILIELYDHTAVDRASIHPLFPHTPTLLPVALDQRLRASQHRLILPAPNRGFWAPLPSTSSLSPTPSAPIKLPSPRAWSQSTALRSPPAIATAQLWTPSQPVPGTQQPQLDYRFGPLAIDWIDSPAVTAAPPLKAPSMSPTLSSKDLAVPAPAPSGSTSPRPTAHRSLSAASNSAHEHKTSPRPVESSGTTELNWGVIHLFKELGVTDAERSDAKAKKRAMDEDDGTVVALVSVPGALTAAAILTFISPALEAIAQLRMLRDSTPNRNIVLIRFYDASEANEFRVVFNGRPYHDTNDSEVAQVVPISSIQLKSSSYPPFTFPYSSSDIDANTTDAVELPTCPICLERLDVQVSGLVQLLCNHGMHCHCMARWGDSRCPVCRATNSRTRKGTVSGHSSQPVVSSCTVCQSPSNLWICVICGNVGCGRYQGGHAHSHFEESGHSYSLEIETGRVWSYKDDEYVHRLIRSRTDGKLVELPSLFNDPDDKEDKNGGKKLKGEGGGWGPDESDEASQDKFEAIGLEYANLMTAQLESQRGYYEEELARAKDELTVLRRKWDEAVSERERANKDRAEMQKRLDKVVQDVRDEATEWRTKYENQNKMQHEDEMRRKKDRTEVLKARKELEKELEAERAVTASLTSNLSSLRLDMQKQQKETMDVRAQVDDMSDQLRDVMFALEARDKIEAQGLDELAGGSISVPDTPSATTSTPKTSSARRKKKR